MGSAYAQALQDTPKEGSLEVGAVVGEALAGHTNYSARAQSQGLDTTSIGSTMKLPNCGASPSQTQLGLVPGPLEAETGQPGADQGITEDPAYGVANEGPNQPVPPSFGSTESVRADGTPFGEADTSYGDVTIPGNPFEVAGMKSKAWSGVVDGVREAGATSDIASLSLAGGTVVLDGMHWEVVYPSGGSEKPTATFGIGMMLIHGTAVSFPDVSAALAAANAVLEPLGMILSAPAVTESQGVDFVTGLTLDVVPNATRDQILGDLINGAAPVVVPAEGDLETGAPGEPQPLVDALCQSDVPITVADVAIAGIDGGGSYTTSFGGVHATSGEAPSNPFSLGFTALGSSSGSNVQLGSSGPVSAGTAANQTFADIGGGTAVPAVPSTGGTGGGSLPGTAGSAAGTSASPTGGSAGGAGGSGSNGHGGYTQPAENIVAAAHVAGGPLLGIGLGGLGALLLLAEGDRRLMRRAQQARAFDDNPEE